ncbi:MAG: hypothetical protein Kow0097_01700 [Candidatus Bipolaricaulota bacterium]|nr:HAD-IA family hydrolase [Candidatus Bipolaricaulota bacterium]
MKLAIVDWGGVVVDHADPVPAMAERLGMTADAFRQVTADDTRRLLGGQITAQAFWERFWQKTGRRVEEELWAKEFRPALNPAVLALLARVRRRVRVVAGTNTMDPHWPALQRSGLPALFDAVYASHVMGLVKPDPQFFLTILREESCDPSEAVFFDDVPENVRAAQGIGITAFQFRDPSELARTLRTLGLLDGVP